MTESDQKSPDNKPSEVSSRPFLPPAHRTPFVVRQRDIKTLTQRLKIAKQGEGVCLALRADSGMGKSRLAYELAYRTRKEDVNVVFVPCRGCGADLQRPLLELVRGILGIDEAAPANKQRGTLEETLKKLLLDDLGDFFLSWLGLSSDRLVNGRDPAELIEALVRVLAAHSENKQAHLIVFDDLEHACDALKVQLPNLIANLRSMPVMILATFSADVPEELQTVFGKEVMTLSELDFADTLKLGSALAGTASLTTELGSLVWKRTAGRPIFVVLLLEGLREEERIVIDKEEDIADLDDKDKPVQHVRDYIYSRISNMSSELRTAILGGVVAGDGFDAKMLGYLIEQDDAALLGFFDDLIEQGWLERSGVGLAATYRFTQGMVREIIYQRMQTDERVRLHRRIGDYLVSVNTDPQAQQLNLIVQHYIDAGTPGLGILAIEPHLKRAYEDQKRERVVELLHRSIDLASTDHTLHEQQVEMAEMLGDIYAAERDYVQAATVYRDKAPTIGSLTLLAKLGLTQLVTEPNRAMNTLAQVAPLIPANQKNDLRWYTEAGIVWGLALTDQTYEAIRRSRDMLAHLGETSGFGSARTLMRGTLGMVLFYSGEKDEAHPHLESARAGWGARDDQDGVVLMNKVLIEMPRHEITRNWLHLAMEPLIARAKKLVENTSK